jgi:hypothetical protein
VPEQAVGAPVWEPPPQEVPTTAALSIDQTASRAAALKSEADAAPAPPRKLKRKRKAVDYQAMFLRTRLSRWVKNTVAAAQFTGRLTVFLVVLSIVLPLITIGLVALTWLALEQRPSPTFQALAAAPPQSIPDPKRNGYFLLLGLGESSSVDPMKAGYERWQRVELQRPRCTDPVEETDRPLLTAADPVALSGWFRGGIPTTQFRVRRAALEGWARSNHLLTSRYEQWFTMLFEDSGFGTLTGPDCAQVLAVHRLYLAGGFAEQLEEGVARLELDMGAWRNVLANAKTLSMKRLALRAIDDDVSLLSDLLARPDLEPKLLPRLTRLARPLEPGERSLRWPMHNEFLAEVRLSERGLYAEMDTESSLALQALTRMPLPKQRALNAHAAYYDGVIKASEVPNAPLPSLYDFAQSPPRGWLDYLKNPVDNLLGMQHVPNWAEYAGSILETDARFRLGGLQARLRVPSRDRTNLLARIAEAGPPFFDPFTELPMLTNGAKTLLYSIGRDGTDNNGDPKQDIIVPIFSAAPVL